MRTVDYVVDMADVPLVARAHAEHFGQVCPASTLVQVAALTPAAARVEVEATAVITEALIGFRGGETSTGKRGWGPLVYEQKRG